MVSPRTAPEATEARTPGKIKNPAFASPPFAACYLGGRFTKGLGFHYERGNAMFKKILLTVALGACALFGGQAASADVYVHGYTRSAGTYVAPHYRSDPDGNFYNNWS